MNNFLLKILLSALLYNLAFYFPSYLGLLAIVYWIPLHKAFISKPDFTGGFLWGIFLYSIHGIWLLILLLTKSQASSLVSLVIYIVIVLYYGLLTGLWFQIMKYIKIRKLIPFFLSLCIYTYMLGQYSLWFLSFRDIQPYPFFSPLIPLASYLSPQTKNVPDYKIIHLSPEAHQSAEIAGQGILHKLLNMHLYQYNQTVLVVSPESSFPFNLNNYKHLVNLWSYALPNNAHLLIGATNTKVVNNSRQSFQSVFHINTRRIIQVYDKSKLMPFVEKSYWPWDKVEWGKELFIKNNNEFCKGTICGGFSISPDLIIKPCICSELFELSNNDHSAQVIFWFVNDSWFIAPFQKWMQNYAKLYSLYIGKPVVYIGFEDIVY